MLPDHRILFVDDDPHVLSAFSRRLRRDVDIVTACGPELGLDEIRSNGPFSVVVVDMQMPGMDGIEFLHLVKILQPHAARIMLTGNADQETAKRAVCEGAIFRFLRKPCSPEDLLAAIHEAIEYHTTLLDRESA